MLSNDVYFIVIFWYFGPLHLFKMWKTAILLIVSLLLLPVGAFFLDKPPTEAQWSIFLILLKIYIILAGLCFLVSSLTNNFSQVDKLWSVMPIVYAWVTVHLAEYEPRLILMAVLVSFWGIRLTYNFARRGGYQWRFWEGEEDYRWGVLKAKPGFQSPWKWTIFNLFFISYYQMGLILLFTIPIVKSVGGSPIGLWDYILAVLILLFLVIETLADQQQWIYQRKKYQRIAQGQSLKGDFKNGFLDKGLWSIVRHPNYAAELSIWIIFYLFSVVATGSWINWSITGAVLLILLFHGSANFSEEISSSKYPEYKNYIDSVPRFVPKFW